MVATLAEGVVAWWGAMAACHGVLCWNNYIICIAAFQYVMFHVQYIVLSKHRKLSWVRNNEATPTAQPRFLMLHATFLGKPANLYAHRSDRYPHGANGSQCGGH